MRGVLLGNKPVSLREADAQLPDISKKQADFEAQQKGPEIENPGPLLFEADGAAREVLGAVIFDQHDDGDAE